MGDSWTSATPMRNSDFKALLTTPRTAAPGGAQQQQREGSSFKHPRPKVPADPDRDKKFKKPHPKRPGKPGAAGDKEKEGEEGPLYRDRAKERREGLNVDFADAEQELAARGLGPTALQSLSIEQSKFLGGDIAHTHLVKGLDYALLNQQRQKLESGSGDGGSGAGPQSAAAAAAAAAAAEATAAAQKAAVKFSTPLGRSVYHAVFRPAGGSRNLVREMFQPRRTAFVFEFGEGGGDVPTTLRRSKADCPAVQDVVSAVSDASLLERISKVMGYINQTSVKGGKRSARDSQYIRSILTGVNPAAPGDGQVHGQLVMKGQAALSAAAAAAAGGPAAAAGQPGGQPVGAAAAAGGGGDVEDDDIFGDAGTDYAPALPQKKEAGGSRRAEGLFENRDHQADLVLPPPPAVGEGGGEVDMDIEEGELPGQQRRQQQQQAAAAAAAAAQGYPGYPAPGAGDYYQQQQAGWQQQQYGQEAYGQAAAQQQQEQPKWRVSTRPGAGGASSSAASSALQGFADEAYAECFPTMADYNVVEEDEEEDPKKARAAAAAAAAAGGGAPGGKGGKGGRGGGGLDDAEKKMHGKLSREVQKMKGIFNEKGWGTEAFKKEDKLDAVAATPARKRLRI